MFSEKTVTCVHPGGSHRVVYSDFNPESTRAVLCVHGLSRNGRDFDFLAKALVAEGFRVICPDMAGRGRSDRLDDAAHYNYGQYLADITALGVQEKLTSVDWVGTSMGGLMGMMVASGQPAFINKLVVNDVGPFVPAEALERIEKYVSLNPFFDSWESYYAAFRNRMASFGLQTEEEWQFLAKISAKQNAQGHYQLNYDTNVVAGLRNGAIADVDVWPLWAGVKQPVLILHGADSDILTQDVLAQMMIGKQATSISFAGVGHAPALLDRLQIDVIRDWLLAQ